MGSLEIGSAALNSFRTALDVTSQNIANANTVGYNRQRAELASVGAADANRLNPGSGVRVTDIQRISDEFLSGQSRNIASDFARLDSFSQLASRIDSLVADDNASLTPALQSFFNSIEQLNTDPASVSNRTVMLGEARSLVDRFNTLESQFSAINTEVNSRIEAVVSEINSLAKNIADLNNKIAGAGSRGAPNELLDSRNLQLKELAKHVSLQTYEQNGQVNVRTSSGIELVTAGETRALTIVRSTIDPQQLEIASSQGLISNQIRGGAIGGVMDFRREMLNPVQNELGRIATVLGKTFNSQHNNGIDLNGKPGTDFFSLSSPISSANSGNAGDATISTTITDAAKLTASDYSVSFNGNDYTVTRLSDQTTTNSNNTSIDLDGLNIEISGNMQSGDEFLIRPTSGGAKNLSLNLTHQSEIAAASPLRARASLNNLSDSSISSPAIDDLNNPGLTTPVEIRFSSATDYELFDAGATPPASLGTGTLAADNSITFNGWSVNFSGTADANTQFTVEPNTGGYADNSNGNALAGLQFTKTVEGFSTFQEGYGQLVNLTGQLTRQANISLNAQEALLGDIENREAASSGVNLDEEAINLTRYQQAYQAAAQVINTSQNLFDTILGVVRR